jgi:hypothetical protein
MRGAVAMHTSTENFRLLAGADNLSCYRFNTKAAEHYFCPTCGIYTHHRRRFDPSQFAVNVACLDGVSPFDFVDVAVVDGARHANDHGGEVRFAGRLRYETME